VVNGISIQHVVSKFKRHSAVHDFCFVYFKANWNLSTAFRQRRTWIKTVTFQRMWLNILYRLNTSNVSLSKAGTFGESSVKLERYANSFARELFLAREYLCLSFWWHFGQVVKRGQSLPRVRCATFRPSHSGPRLPGPPCFTWRSRPILATFSANWFIINKITVNFNLGCLINDC
jgi:hypothetical protein